MQHEFSNDVPEQPDPSRQTIMMPDEASPAPQPGPESPPQPVPVDIPMVKPRFTYIILGLIVAVYLAGQILPNQVLYGTYRVTAEVWLIQQGAKINEAILQEGQVYRLLTAIFLHGGLAHLFFNGYALYVIGQGVERFYGYARFLIIFFLGGLTASVASLVFSTATSVGASGALFAIFGAEMVFLYHNRRIFGAVARRRLTSLINLLVLNLLIGFLGSALIDNWAHIGGLLGGVALSWLIGPRFKAEYSWESSRVEIVDENPLASRILVPFLWAAGLILVVGAMMQL